MLDIPKSTLGRRFFIRSLSVALPVLLTFLTLEIALRISGFRSPVINAEMYRINENDSLLPYSLQPGYVGYYAGGAVRVNKDGNRIVPLPARNTVSFAHHTVILGDSVAFGQGLDDNETIAANLQNIVGTGDEPARVTLISAPGYTSWNEYAIFLDRYKTIADIDKLVLIYVNNDVTINNDHFDFKTNGKEIYYMVDTWGRRFRMVLYENSRVASLILSSARRVLYYFAPQSISMETVDKDIPTQPLDYSMDAVEKIQMLCLQHGIDFWVAIYRDPYYYHNADGYENYEKQIVSALEGINVKNFILNQATDMLSEADYKVSWNEGHPSAAATRIMASQIIEETEDREK